MCYVHLPKRTTMKRKQAAALLTQTVLSTKTTVVNPSATHPHGNTHAILRQHGNAPQNQSTQQHPRSVKIYHNKSKKTNKQQQYLCNVVLGLQVRATSCQHPQLARRGGNRGTGRQERLAAANAGLERHSGRNRARHQAGRHACSLVVYLYVCACSVLCLLGVL